MNKSLYIIIKGIAIFKFFLSIFFAISLLTVASDLWAVRNQIEGRELVQDESQKLYSLLITLLATIATLLFDIKVLRLKNAFMFNKCISLTLLSIVVVFVGIYFKVQWLGISLMLMVSIYAIYLLLKYSPNKK